MLRWKVQRPEPHSDQKETNMYVTVVTIPSRENETSVYGPYVDADEAERYIDHIRESMPDEEPLFSIESMLDGGKIDEPDVGFVHDEHTRMYPALVRLWVRAGDKASADQITDDLLATYMDVDTGEHGHVGVAERA